MVTFKPHQKEDLLFRVKWLNNPEANKFTVENPKHKTTLLEQIKWLEDYEKNESKRFFTILEDNQPVGFMGLSNIHKANRSANLFIMIGEDDARGKGIGEGSIKYLIKYGFEKLGLNSIELEVDKRNISALSLYKKLGFAQTSEDKNEIKMVLKKGMATPA